MAQTCSRCGSAAGDDAYFCPHCSNRLAGPSFAAPILAAPARRSRFPLVLLGLGLCLILGVAGAFVYLQVNQIHRSIDEAVRITAVPASQYVAPPPIGDYPPSGAIWFGSSFDATTFDVRDHASSFVSGVQVVLVAHSTQLIPEGQRATLVFDSYDFQTQAASAGGFDTYGMVVSSVFLTAGSHTAILRDLGGNELARGTLTIAP